MTATDWLLIAFFTALFLALIPLIGGYMASIFTGRLTYPAKILLPLESLCYRMGGIDPDEEMSWQRYAKTLFLFNAWGFIFLFLLQSLQKYLPLNSQHFDGVPWPLAFNTAASFATNTNWQSYAGENTLSYLTQMLGLTSQQFLSAATGMATALTLTRGLVRKAASTVGNFWVDVVRTVIYLLLPLSILTAIFLVSQGVIQTLSPYVQVETLDNAKQTIPLGPVASQIAIKQLGTNGGGFFNANSAHPFENPTPLSNAVEMLAILLVPAACLYTYGIMVGSVKHAGLLFAAMFFLWLTGLFATCYFENTYNPVIGIYPILEGQETRFATTNSLLWAVSTTATANGSVNAMLSSLSPLTGGIALFNIMLGELIFGGIGVGLCSMLMMTLLTVFLSGLMVGRTPEYFGKKVEKKEMQWVVMAVLTPSALILCGAGISCLLPTSLASLGNQGPHGLSEILYAFSSAAENNGSAFAGLNANTLYYNLVLGIAMALGRMCIILPSLAIAGLLAQKNTSPTSTGTFSTHSPLFGCLLISVILFVGGLTFFPALSLGPIVEYLLMLEGRVF